MKDKKHTEELKTKDIQKIIELLGDIPVPTIDGECWNGIKMYRSKPHKKEKK